MYMFIDVWVHGHVLKYNVLTCIVSLCSQPGSTVLEVVR